LLYKIRDYETWQRRCLGIGRKMLRQASGVKLLMFMTTLYGMRAVSDGWTQYPTSVRQNKQAAAVAPFINPLLNTLNIYA
jgi:hypothetical protein